METTLTYNPATPSPSTSTRYQTRLHFKKADRDSIGVLTDFLSRYPSRSSDFSVGGIVIWADYFNYEYAIYEDTLYIKGNDEHGIFFHLPIGATVPSKALGVIHEYCLPLGIAARIIVPDECDALGIDDCEALHPSYMPDWREYVYGINQFTHFSGKKMQQKRNHLNYFLKNYADFQVEMIDDSKAGELIEFNDRFNLYHKEGNSFDYESHATAEVLRHYSDFPFFGILIRYNGEVIGYTFGELVGDTFSVHAEKGNIDYRGVYQALSSQLSQRILESNPEVKFLNREDDMGNDYLRQSKMSYHPVKFIAKWEISA